MADVKKSSKPQAKDKPKVKVLDKDDCKKIKGGLSSQVGGGLAGPEDFRGF